ncbi:hypothetical protein DFH06DRAFT_508620 [Mycena polygramma]|nr:hypothetical protein DFH06DRAFT_508620 [Mycena polygramma]
MDGDGCCSIGCYSRHLFSPTRGACKLRSAATKLYISLYRFRPQLRPRLLGLIRSSAPNGSSCQASPHPGLYPDFCRVSSFTEALLPSSEKSPEALEWRIPSSRRARLLINSLSAVPVGIGLCSPAVVVFSEPPFYRPVISAPLPLPILCTLAYFTARCT